MSGRPPHAAAAGPLDAEQRVEVLRDAVMAALRRTRGDEPDIVAWHFVPGRIEVVGKHTDYAAGRSLLAAVDRGFLIAAARRSDNLVRVIDCATGESVEIDDGRLHHRAERFAPASVDAAPERGAARMKSTPRALAPSWATYPLTVLRRCTRNFPSATGGADLAFMSDLPQAAGLSSSSALVVATFLALDAVRGMSGTMEYRTAIDGRADLAGYLGAVENGMSFHTLDSDTGVGTLGGSEDHTAILCARPGRLVQYSYAPVRFEADVAMPHGWRFVVGSSGVRAEKAGPALKQYNRLARSAQRLVALWREAGAGAESTLAGIVASAADAPLRLRDIVRQRAAGETDELLDRLAQFSAENEDIVPGARAALERGDISGFAAQVRRSQELAEQRLRNQTVETVHLVQRAAALGAAAASAFGAGFGGSVWALVQADDAHDFLSAWRSDYIARFSERRSDATFFITTAAAPATRLDRDSDE